MTPDEARALLDGTTPGPWRLQEIKGHPHLRYIATGTGHSGDPTAAVCIPVDMTSREGAANMTAKAAVPSMLATLASMTTEYGVEVQRPNGAWAPPQSWHDSPDRAIACVTAIHGWGTANRRIIRRYVTEPESVE